MAAAFEKAWGEELKREDPSLFRALLASYGTEFAWAGLFKLVHDCCVFVGPQVLHSMIMFLRNPDSPLSYGLGLTTLVTLSQLTMSLCLRHYFFKCYTTGLRVRTAVVVAIYHKALKLSASERQTRSSGEITNLMSIDAQRLQDLTTYLHAIWYSPLQISLALLFLWKQLGASSLGGVLVIVTMIPVTKIVAQWMGSMQKLLMRAKDQRVDLNGEVLASMKVVKFQAWEEPFQSRILALREVELHQLLRYYIVLSLSRMLWTFTPLMVALATFSAYVWSGHVLDVASALTSLALFEILRFPLFMLPQIISNIVEATVALKRIQSFLLCKDHKPVEAGNLDNIGIRMEGVSAAYDSKRPKVNPQADPVALDLLDKQWEVKLLKSQLNEAEHLINRHTGKAVYGSKNEGDEEAGHSLLCLKRIEFECKPGELVAVIGSVGCGKSSFINALLGEVRALTGSTSVCGKMAYFSQVPFIMNASVRDNILFSHTDEEVDEAMYQRCLRCCALKHDLDLLPNGDRTEIGEKGITLSGGQKARVALARVVYHRADLSLIDDALAAVDAHVAKQLFEEAIVNELLSCGAAGMESRSVIMVTNALQYLSHPRVDRIIVLQDGHIVESGTYNELKNGDSVFAGFLAVLRDTGTDLSGHLVEGVASSDSNGVSDESGNLVCTGREADIEAELPVKLMTDESRQSGHVKPSVYLSWIKAAGGLFAPVAILLAFGFAEGISVLSNWWITYWSGHGSLSSQSRFLAIYALINGTAALFGLFRTLLVVIFGLKVSRKLFANLLSVILHAPMSFFDTTPVGRLVNRFSKDMYTIDEQLMGTLRTYLQTLFGVFSTLLVISSVTPLFLLCLVPMLIFYLKEQSFFTISYRELKRLDSVSRSPIYALLGESVDGVAVIRAFAAQKSLLCRLTDMLDIQQHAYFLTCAAQSWLAVRLELIGTLIVTFAALSAVLEHTRSGADGTFAGLAGLSISYALSVTQSLNWSVRMASDMEANMVAVERVEEYSNIQSEGLRSTPVDAKLPQVWPPKGAIEFTEVRLRYRPGLPFVLKGLNLTIPPGSKIGVVGRTGAGKSTLMIALMRIVDVTEGTIKIDGTDISEIGLARLRRTLAVIPQDPVLFSGSVRSNLDPFHEYEDDALLDILDRVGLYARSRTSSTQSLPSLGQICIRTLTDVIAEGGINFSVGQRQLLVIARALLRGAKIVIMDEATAAVDAGTDAAIQKVIRTEFTEATCITVAHRINTILDSDYILVMSDGKAEEFDKPDMLLKKGGLFRDLVRASADNT